MLVLLRLMLREMPKKLPSNLRTAMIPLLNFKDSWMPKPVWKDWLQDSLLNQMLIKLPSWPKNLVFQWLQNSCNSETTKLFQTLLLKLPSEWVKLKMRSLKLSDQMSNENSIDIIYIDVSNILLFWEICYNLSKLLLQICRKYKSVAKFS